MFYPVQQEEQLVRLPACIEVAEEIRTIRLAGARFLRVPIMGDRSELKESSPVPPVRIREGPFSDF